VTQVRHRLITLGLTSGLVAMAGHCAAQQWPAKPLRIIVPFPPGQAGDIITRTVSERLSPLLGQQILVDNRPGAGAALGTELAAKAAPDGYTFLAGGSAALAINPHLYRKIGYDTLRDFAPITQIVSIAMVFVVTPSLPAKNVQEFIRLAKQKPGEMNYGSSGSGSTSHLVTAVLASQAGMQLTHVPYKGAVPALTDLMAGQVMLVADTIPVVSPHVAAGKMRALAVSTIKRAPQLPDLHTVDEQGIKGYDLMTWTSFVAPSGVPAAILDRMSAETVKIIHNPDMNKRLIDMGFVPVGSSREQFGAFVRREHAAWQKAVQVSGARVE
jgi:tripartite-type tricarboxylate transporter receptor subunit TctC